MVKNITGNGADNTTILDFNYGGIRTHIVMSRTYLTSFTAYSKKQLTEREKRVLHERAIEGVKNLTKLLQN